MCIQFQHHTRRLQELKGWLQQLSSAHWYWPITQGLMPVAPSNTPGQLSGNISLRKEKENKKKHNQKKKKQHKDSWEQECMVFLKIFFPLKVIF